jgi:hypothetical protein
MLQKRLIACVVILASVAACNETRSKEEEDWFESTSI